MNFICKVIFLTKVQRDDHTETLWCMWIDSSPGDSLGSDIPNIDFPPQGNDGDALTICPLDHVDGVKIFFRLKSNWISDLEPFMPAFKCVVLFVLFGTGSSTSPPSGHLIRPDASND